jgi:uncharacterized protein (TIGR04255 family)
MLYKKNFLRQVIFNINFDNIEILKITLDQKLLTICQDVTKASLIESKSTQVSFRGGDLAVDTSYISTWEFNGESIQIKIQSNFLQVINLKYTNHKDYHEKIKLVYDTLISIYSPNVMRTSFRYVNNISFPTGETFDFKKYINPSLLTPTQDFVSEGLSRSIGLMTINSQEITTNFTYGFINPEFPNKIAKREFILDFEAIMNPNGQISSIKDILEKLRTKVNHLFEKSILEDLRKLMNK